jgi:nucleotide-binding universal stress UspA family protein
MSETWMVAFDFSEQAMFALRRASELLSGLGGGDLLVVHVHRPMSTGFGAEFAAVSPAFRDVDKVIQESAVNRMAEVLAPMKDSFPRITFASRVEPGYPPDRLVAIAAEAGASQIVIGSHGRKGLERFFLGSVAERVARLADRPVLIVKGDPKATQPATP